MLDLKLIEQKNLVVIYLDYMQFNVLYHPNNFFFHLHIFQMGFPVIHVEIANDQIPVQVKVSQKRFLIFEDKTMTEDKTYR